MPSNADAFAVLRALIPVPTEKVITHHGRTAWLEDARTAYESFQAAYEEIAKHPVGSPAYRAALKHLAETNRALTKVLDEGRPHV